MNSQQQIHKRKRANDKKRKTLNRRERTKTRQAKTRTIRDDWCDWRAGVSLLFRPYLSCVCMCVCLCWCFCVVFVVWGLCVWLFQCQKERKKER